MTKLSNKQRESIVKLYNKGAKIRELCKTFKVTPATIKYHVAKATWNNTQKPDKSTWNNNHKHSIVNANGKPFSYSATTLFWGSVALLVVVNLFMLRHGYGR